MISEKDVHRSHRKHRNVLYSLVVLLAIIQIASLIFVSIQVSKLNLKLDSAIQKSGLNSRKYTDSMIQKYDSLYQESFSDISKLLSSQKADFQQEINLLKTSKDDFTEVIQSAVKSVVTVTTDKSVGTGFVIDKNGYIVTNYHVVSDSAGKLKIIDFDRNSFTAQLVGKDESRDLALLKTNGTFDAISIANSDETQVGEKVIAIGNPLGLSYTVTEGIVSGLHRPGPNGLNEYIQTDVPLNPGNSGGPLINIQGKVIGVNNFKIGDAEAIGFAIESNSVRNAINSIANNTLIK